MMAGPDLLTIRRCAGAIQQRVAVIRRSTPEGAEWHLQAILGMCKVIAAEAVAPKAEVDDHAA